MNQVLHIFAKDTRRMALEILISLALLATLVAIYPRHWAPDSILGGVAGNAVSFSLSGAVGEVALSAFLQLLIPLSWWVLIASVIHEEKLVGDRQFWVTRPYEWFKLLGAKALFVLAFVYVPLFIAQCLIFLEAGVQPFAHLPGMLYNLLTFTTVLLPIVVLAALTRNFARMTLMLLGAIIGLVVLSSLIQLIPGSDIASPIGVRIAQILVLGGCATALLLQYESRRTTRTWLLLLAALVLILVDARIAPDQWLMNRTYPSASANIGVAISYGADATNQPTVYVARQRNEVGIGIPVQISSIPEGVVIFPEDMRVTLESRDGSRWTSLWQPLHMEKFLAGERVSMAGFSMPGSVYRRMKSTPVRMQVELAFARAQKTRTDTVALPLRDFDVPGVGICTAISAFALRPGEIGAVLCRAALRQPPLIFVQTAWRYDDCHAVPQYTTQTSGWLGAVDRPPAEFGIVPLWINPLPLSQSAPAEHVPEPQHMCPGQPITFTSYELSQRAQAAFNVQAFRLPEMNAGQAAVIANP
jgi:hypothetical protein